MPPAGRPLVAQISIEQGGDYLNQVLMPLGIFGGSLALLLVIRHLVLSRLTALGRQQRARGLLVEFVDTIRFGSFIWCVAGAMAIAIRFAKLPAESVRQVGLWIVVFLIISFSLVFSSAAVRLISAYGERQGMPFAVAGLSRTLTRVLVLAIGALTLLHYLGISITPMLATLGVGGIAVALALQDTLANFFAGIHILVETPISVGEFIRLSTGEEGTVTDIGWRTTRVLTGANNTIVIPNTKITSGILTNYSLPDRRVVAEVVVHVALTADVERAIQIALETARVTEGVLESPEPVAFLDPGVLPTHIQFRVFVHIRIRTDQIIVQSALRRAILQRFREESIPLAQVMSALPAV